MTGSQSLVALLLLTGLLMFGAGCARSAPVGPRQTVSLDGTWDLAQGSMDRQPAVFDRKIAVPGLIDMAQPAFTEVGRKSPQRQAFWYRRTFAVDGQVPAFATLMIRKARYGTKVWLNGQVVGEHLPCFTPALLDVRPHLKGDGQPNELVIRIGADRDSMPQDMPTGWDFEKYLFIPGIYDSVELILNGGPRIVNVQTVPDIEKKQVRIVAELQAADQAVHPVYAARVSQWRGGRIVGSAAGEGELVPPGQTRKIDFTIDIADCRLWSPEDPFLYELLLTTGGDAVKVRFGMRSFTFDPETKLALLNGRPYYMRGTNVTIYRHFEDADRGDKPWRKEWVRRLHRHFRAMHWTAIRYCIGFPPDFWYDIADEEGFLIQDEFPIWLLNPNHKPPSPEQPVAEKIIPEYIEWMRHRWNHPCVVIWDGQNESQTDETGKAIRAVRGLDLSNRPWENGWAEPNSASDCIESHPYLFIRTWYSDKPFRMSELASHDGKPHLTEAQKKLNVAVIINEYDWLWLDRQGNPTCLTDKVYESLLGKNSTVEQRRYTRARLVAALTEFWRCHRHAAGVLHFCGLGYSRPGDKPRPEGGATSDDFIDIEKLTFEPKFFEYVGESFNPVGLMVNFWDQTLPAGGDRTIQVYVINDLYADWKGNVRLRFMKGDREATAQILPCTVKPLGREILSFSVKAPADRGDYTIVADLVDGTGRRIRSLRDVRVE